MWASLVVTGRGHSEGAQACVWLLEGFIEAYLAGDADLVG